MGDTTLMSSLRKRNLPTSSWNLLPQLFIHVSNTWGLGYRVRGPMEAAEEGDSHYSQEPESQGQVLTEGAAICEGQKTELL